ncbi:hypothetical protein [Spongiactinospora sp. 9N601]|uniref:hypothetical protein n=1 Tax=Spongiactinospora sp. 9N601 TaxID=3375149 RepID=UPI00379D16DD
MDVFSAYSQNDILLSMMKSLLGDEVDLEPVKKAFESTKGDFAAKFAAAVHARFAQMVVPELFINVPEHPEELRKTELERLVRPAADGSLRSYPTKGELLAQAERIRRRQNRRPPWIPRVDRNGKPIPRQRTDSFDTETRPARPLMVTALAELGDVTVLLPALDEERPDLTMMPGGIGEWEAALCTVLGVTSERGPATTVPIDAKANEALVPEDTRWWTTEPPQSRAAAQDPGVASELLATSATLGGLPVTDNTQHDSEMLDIALVSAGDWRHSVRWLLDAWEPGDGSSTLAVARAAVAGWTSEDRSGLIVYVYGGALHSTEGLIGVPSPLHSYLLWARRAADGTDTVDAVRRVILSCPGEDWCHRGGCPEGGFLEAAELLTSIATTGDIADVADRDGTWAGETYRQMYGADGVDNHSEDVLDYLAVKLSGAGWVELIRSIWEGGMEESLLRRGEHCLTALYDPVTRQLRLIDGQPELENMLQLLSDDGVLIGNDDHLTVETGERAAQEWGNELLTAAEDLLRGRINELQQPSLPVQGTLLGLHPHADGALRAPESIPLAEGQLTVLLHTAGLLSGDE